MNEMGDRIHASANEHAGEMTDDNKLKIKGKLGHIAANLRVRIEDITDIAGDKISGALDDIKHRTGKDPEE